MLLFLPDLNVDVLALDRFTRLSTCVYKQSVVNAFTLDLVLELEIKEMFISL